MAAPVESLSSASSESSAWSTSSVSAKQFRANRRNAQRSTGPRTEEGKAASARNADYARGVLCRSAPARGGCGGAAGAEAGDRRRAVAGGRDRARAGGPDRRDAVAIAAAARGGAGGATAHRAAQHAHVRAAGAGPRHVLGAGDGRSVPGIWVGPGTGEGGDRRRRG